MENNQDKGKTVAIISYITLIGFVVAIIMHNDDKNKSELGAFHLRQSLGIMITGIALSFCQLIFVFIPFIGWLINGAISIALIALFVFWILGLISAINQEKKELPFIGSYYQKYLNSIK